MSSDNALDIKQQENEQLDYLYQETQALSEYENSKEYADGKARYYMQDLQKRIAQTNSRPNPFNDSRNDDPSFYMHYE